MGTDLRLVRCDSEGCVLTRTSSRRLVDLGRHRRLQSVHMQYVQRISNPGSHTNYQKTSVVSISDDIYFSTFFVLYINNWEHIAIAGFLLLCEASLREKDRAILFNSALCNWKLIIMIHDDRAFRENLTTEIKLMQKPSEFIEWSESVEREDYIESRWR